MSPLPHVAAKLDHVSIVTPAAFAQHHDGGGWLDGHAAPSVAIMLYHRGLAERLVASHPATVVPYMFADHFLLDETGGQVAIVANFGIGAPSATLVMEDLINAGVTTVLSVGTSGALQPDLAPGQIVLIDEAIRDEGTSHHYAPAGEPARATPALTDELSAELARTSPTGAPPRRGVAWTTDAPYRETAHEVQQLRERGVLAVEMELAALFTVARLRGVEIAGVLTVSDVLHEHDWVPQFHAGSTMAGLEAGFAATLAVARTRIAVGGRA